MLVLCGYTVDLPARSQAQLLMSVLRMTKSFHMIYRNMIHSKLHLHGVINEGINIYFCATYGDGRRPSAMQNNGGGFMTCSASHHQGGLVLYLSTSAPRSAASS